LQVVDGTRSCGSIRPGGGLAARAGFSWSVGDVIDRLRSTTGRIHGGRPGVSAVRDADPPADIQEL